MSKLGEAVTAWRLHEDSPVPPAHTDLASDTAGRIRRKRRRKEGRTQRAKKRAPIHIHVEWKPAAHGCHNGGAHGGAHGAAQGSSVDVCQQQPRSEPVSIQVAPALQGTVTHARPRACSGNAGAASDARSAHAAVDSKDSKPLVTDAHAKAHGEQLEVCTGRYAQLQVCTQHASDDARAAGRNEDVFVDGQGLACKGSPSERGYVWSKQDAAHGRDSSRHAHRSCTDDVCSEFELVSPPSSNKDLNSPTVNTAYHHGHRYFGSDSPGESLWQERPASHNANNAKLVHASELCCHHKQGDKSEDCLPSPSVASAKVAVEGSLWGDMEASRGGDRESSECSEGNGLMGSCQHGACGSQRRHIQFVAREGETPTAIIQQVCTWMHVCEKACLTSVCVLQAFVFYTGTFARGNV